MKKEEKIPVYELIVSNDTVDGVTAMSLVDEPAVEVNFLTFNKQEKINFKIENEEKRIITGPALIPDKQIYRYNKKTGEEYYVYFSNKTVEKLAHNFILDNKQNNITLQHQVNGNGVKLIESWLSKNENELDLGLPIGTWFVSYKISNDEIWEDVKSGEFNGFSIEVFTTMISTDLSKDIEGEVLEEINILDKEISEMNDEEIELLINTIGDLISNKK